MLLGKSRGQLLIAPDGMKQLVQSGNYSGVDVSGDESLSLMLQRTVFHRNLDCQVHESR